MKINYQSGNALRHLLHTSLLATSLLALSGNAQAATVNNDLVGPGYSAPDPVGTATNGTSTTVNGAVFTVAPDNSGTGTGAFNPFLRTNNTGNTVVESGFNTDATVDVLDNIKDSNWTHSVKLSELTTIDYSGDKYVRLFLDLGEPSGGDNKALISMLELELWVHTISDDADYADGLGAKVWDLDGLTNTTVNLDYDIIKGGNGKYDLIALFDASIFSAYNSNSYFYLYNKFGIETISPPEYASESTFEEWAFDTTGSGILFGCNDPGYAATHQCGGGGTGNNIPEPSVLALLGIGLLGAGMSRANKKA